MTKEIAVKVGEIREALEENDSNANPEKRKARVAVKEILHRINIGAATPGDIAAARELNAAFGLGYSADIEIAVGVMEAKISAAAQADLSTVPYLASKLYEEFLGSPEMKFVLGVHEKLSKGIELVGDELLESTQAIFKIHEEHLEKHKGVKIRKAALEEKYNSGAANAEEQKELLDLVKKNAIGERINYQHHIFNEEVKKTGRSVEEILADNKSSIQIVEKINGKFEAIDRQAAIDLDRVSGKNRDFSYSRGNSPPNTPSNKAFKENKLLEARKNSR